MNRPPPSAGRWITRLVILLILMAVFAWYFLGPVVFDLNRLWALCTGA